ncbi:MAG: CBS domain-containing protein [Treponema sp.]|nr:CBS domain-containing protein [Treponema sp.]
MNVAFGHTNMDPDCFGSLVFVKKLFPDYVLVRSRLIHPVAYTLYDFFESYFNFIEAVDMERETIENIIVVDTSSSARIQEYLGHIHASNPDITIYDHHPAERCDIFGARRVGFSLGANTSGLGRIARERGIRLESEEATIALTGIYADTGCLIYENVKPLDMEIAAWLLDMGASLKLVKSFLETIKEDEQVRVLNRLLLDVRPVTIQGNEILVSYLELDRQVSGLAAVVDKIAGVKNPDAYFAVFFIPGKNTALVIARSQKSRIDLHELLAPYGGGGHQAAASAKLTVEDGRQFYDNFQAYLERSLAPALCAGDIMSRNVFSINEDRSLLEASKYMEQVNHTGLPVLNGAGELTGFLTLKEIMKGRKNSQMNSPVRSCMIRKVISIPPETTMREIERLFFRHHIGYLPVMRNNELAGIVSRGDYIRSKIGPDFAGGGISGSAETGNAAEE